VDGSLVGKEKFRNARLSPNAVRQGQKSEQRVDEDLPDSFFVTNADASGRLGVWALPFSFERR
jgi:hypothetical protein